MTESERRAVLNATGNLPDRWRAMADTAAYHGHYEAANNLRLCAADLELTLRALSPPPASSTVAPPDPPSDRVGGERVTNAGPPARVETGGATKPPAPEPTGDAHLFSLKAVVGNGTLLTACCSCGWSNSSPKTRDEAIDLHAAHLESLPPRPGTGGGTAGEWGDEPAVNLALALGHADRLCVEGYRNEALVRLAGAVREYLKATAPKGDPLTTIVPPPAPEPTGETENRYALALQVLDMWREYRFCCSDTPSQKKLDKMLYDCDEATARFFEQVKSVPPPPPASSMVAPEPTGAKQQPVVICDHGINHSGERHGCDGCCQPAPPPRPGTGGGTAGEAVLDKVRIDCADALVSMNAHREGLERSWEAHERDLLDWCAAWLLRAYEAMHREGWEEGMTEGEASDALRDVLSNLGCDAGTEEPAQVEKARRLLFYTPLKHSPPLRAARAPSPDDKGKETK